MFLTKRQMVNAFSNWDKCYREHPEEFNKLPYPTSEIYGENAANCFMHYLGKDKCPTGRPFMLLVLILFLFLSGCSTKETTITQVYEPDGYVLSVKCDGNWTATINDTSYSEYGSRDFSIPGDYILAKVDRTEDAFIYVALYRGWELINDARSRTGMLIIIGDSL